MLACLLSCSTASEDRYRGKDLFYIIIGMGPEDGSQLSDKIEGLLGRPDAEGVLARWVARILGVMDSRAIISTQYEKESKVIGFLIGATGRDPGESGVDMPLFEHLFGLNNIYIDTILIECLLSNEVAPNEQIVNFLCSGLNNTKYTPLSYMYFQALMQYASKYDMLTKGGRISSSLLQAFEGIAPGQDDVVDRIRLRLR